MDLAMESSSMCEKNKDLCGGEKLKESLLINSPFELEIFALKLVEKTSEIDVKN